MTNGVFVGRERELARLRSYLDNALAGQGKVCFVVGQAGSGKTALMAHFIQQALAADPDLVVAMGSCNAQTGIGDPYLPFREALTMLTGGAPAKQGAKEIASEGAGRLRTVLVRSVQTLVEVAPDLIGLFVPGAKLAGVVGKALADKMGWIDGEKVMMETLTAIKRAGADMILTYFAIETIVSLCTHHPFSFMIFTLLLIEVYL